MFYLAIILKLYAALLAVLELQTKRNQQIIWQEEFDTLDTGRWKHLITGWRGGNDEFQYYTNRTENSYVRNGILYIKPTLTSDRFCEKFLYKGFLNLSKEGCNVDINGGCNIFGGSDEIANPIQSARLVTSDSFSFTFGKIEVRAKMPKGDWLWPAIWMLPTDKEYGSWVRSGEIDIVESRGNAHFVCDGKQAGRQYAGQTLHWGPDGRHNAYEQTNWQYIKNDPDFSSAFHIYRVEWRSNGFKFSIDDHVLSDFTVPAGGFWELGRFKGDNLWKSGTVMAPFDKRFHFIVNVAVGGNFFGDRCVNGGYQKPWKRYDPQAMKKFWESRNNWLPTWNPGTEDSALQIDWIRVSQIN